MARPGPLGVLALSLLVACGGAACAGTSGGQRPQPRESHFDRAWMRVHQARNIAQLQALPSQEEIAERLALTALLMDEREFGAARRELAFLARARPDSFELHYLHGRALLFGEGDVEGAGQAAERCIEADPRIGRCHELRAMTLQDQGDPDAAIASYRRAQELDPWLLHVDERVARLLLQLGRPGEAAEVVRSALASQRRNAALWLLLGTASEQGAEWADAEAAYLQAARLHSDPRQAWAHLVRMYRATGRDSDAEALLRSTQR